MKDIYENYSVMPKNSKAVIWGLDSEMFDIFGELVNRRRQVACFVDTKDEFSGAEGKIFGKPIIKKEELIKIREREDLYILAGKNVDIADLSWLDRYFREEYCLCFAADIDAAIINSEDLYIYGAGDSGKRTYAILKEQGITVNAFIDSDSRKWGNKIEDSQIDSMVYGPDILKKSDTIIISTRYYHEIKTFLLDKGVSEKNIYVDIRNSWESSKEPLRYADRENLWIESEMHHWVRGIPCREFFTVLLADVYCKKKIILYGLNGTTSQFISLFRALGIEVDYCADYIDHKDILEKYKIDIPYKDVSALACEDSESKMIFVIKIEEAGDKIKDTDYTRLEKLGKIYFKEFRLCFDYFFQRVRRNPRIEVGFGTKVDVLLGHTEVYKRTSKRYPGYIVLGDEKNAKSRVLILGGSTSDVGLYEHYIKSWPEYLYEILRDTVIFCGAIPGYNSKQELLKLLRDGKQLKPDLVISYSGVNDIGQAHTEGYPYAGRQLNNQNLSQMVWGVETDQNLAEEWIESEKMMKVIANSYGAGFLGLFQPIIINRSEEGMTFEERVLRKLVKMKWTDLKEYEMYQQEIKRKISDIPYIHDLTGLYYREKDTVFRDVCHVTELGNSILARKVYELIKVYFSKKS